MVVRGMVAFTLFHHGVDRKRNLDSRMWSEESVGQDHKFDPGNQAGNLRDNVGSCECTCSTSWMSEEKIWSKLDEVVVSPKG